MEIFKCIKPNPYPLKRDKGKLGYGYLSRRAKYHKVNRRKALRQIRKYGFDITETWNLDNTIMMWLSDNVGGFFRECGNFDDWSNYDLNGVPYKEANPKLIVEAEETRRDYFLDNLDMFLKDYTGPLKEKFIKFVIPRIHFLADHSCGYPAGVKSFESWQKQLHSIANKLETEHYSVGFLIHFFSLWD